ncbi:uncharacterized protein [Mytilus edulis]|uniref:uncharacterized protein isoform X2 n=1 Tax=Mytilus edulis TaxID=6550 RepID=UPI0039F04EAF
MNVQNENNGVNIDYPMKTLRAFGGLHIGIGILCAILGITVFIIDNVDMSKDCYINNNGTYYYDKECEHELSTAQSFFLFDIMCVLFSGWFIITGSFPFCMTQRRQSSWRCLRVEPRTDTVVLSSFIAVFGVHEWVIAIAAASYCCCCTSRDDTDNSVVYATFGQHTNV